MPRSDHTTEARIRLIQRELEEQIREIEAEQPEEPGFMLGYNYRAKKWYAQLGTDYAGYFEGKAVIQVFLPHSFDTLDDLLSYMEELIEEAQE